MSLPKRLQGLALAAPLRGPARRSTAAKPRAPTTRRTRSCVSGAPFDSGFGCTRAAIKPPSTPGVAGLEHASSAAACASRRRPCRWRTCCRLDRPPGLPSRPRRRCRGSRALSTVAAVEARVHPAPDHLARGVLVAQVLGEPPASLPLGVAGPLDPAVEAPLALASVPEAVLGEHRPGVTLGGELQPVVGLEPVAVALRALVVDQAGDRLADLGKGDLMGMGQGVGTGGGGRGDPRPKGEGQRRRRRSPPRARAAPSTPSASAMPAYQPWPSEGRLATEVVGTDDQRGSRGIEPEQRFWRPRDIAVTPVPRRGAPGV